MKAVPLILSEDWRSPLKCLHDRAACSWDCFCFVISLHIQNIPLVHRSDQGSHTELGGTTREGRKPVQILSDHNLRSTLLLSSNRIALLPRESRDSQIIFHIRFKSMLVPVKKKIFVWEQLVPSIWKIHYVKFLKEIVNSPREWLSNNRKQLKRTETIKRFTINSHKKTRGQAISGLGN